MFEEGELKNQSLSAKISCYQARVQATISECLTEDFRIEILQDAIDRELSEREGI